MDLSASLEDRHGAHSFDFWVEHANDQLSAHIRTLDPDVANAVTAASVSASTVVSVLDEVPSAKSVTHDDDLAKLVIEHVEGAQGMFIDVETGVLVIDVHDSNEFVGVHDIPGLEEFGIDEIDINLLDEPIYDTITVRGGVALGSCTAGFPARQSSYIGYYSAAHCGISQATYANTAGTGASVTGTRRHYVHNSNGDIGFYSVATSNTVVGTFHGSSSSTPTVVSAPIDNANGATICSRGKTLGWRCGTVRSNAYRPTYSGACPTGTCNATFVSVGVGTAGGDSGGPWVSGGNRPVGIHKGGSSSQSILSKIQYAPSATDLW